MRKPNHTDPSDFRVTWAIDAFDCEGPVAAAQQAYEAFRRAPGGGVFIVTDSKGYRFKVDLQDAEPEAVREN